MGYEQIAAVDLGSNSFRLEVGRVLEDQVYPLDSLKEPVRLASGLTPEKTLDEVSRQRALEALSRFGERLRGFSPRAVRAVATNTLRVAKDAASFLPEAEAALGFPIEIIGGREEARLIYIGVAHAMPPTRHKRLVVDIGGGSTEFIIGKQTSPLLMESLFIGCVSHSLRYFPDGRVDAKGFFAAEVAAARQIETIASEYRALGWTEAAASSGTARAVAELLEANSLNPKGVTGITRAGVEALKAQLIGDGSAEKLKLPGLRPDRYPVFAGGLAILSAVFSALGLERVVYAEGALRLGVLYDLLGRFQQHDMREATVQQFVRRYHVDAKQIVRVERMALALFSQLVNISSAEHESELRLLRWAAALHEIGLSIAHGGFHKHGAYIVRYADMPGFSKQEQENLSFLILGQRGKLERLAEIRRGAPLWRLVFCLRLAALLCRSRSDDLLPDFAVAEEGGDFTLSLPDDWLDASPLTAAALEEEVQRWQCVGRRFRVRRFVTALRA